MKRLPQGTNEAAITAGSGFTLLELMIVIAVCLIMASFAAPIYSRIVTRSHEAVLKDNLIDALPTTLPQQPRASTPEDRACILISLC